MRFLRLRGQTRPLPKAALIRVERTHGRPFFAAFRLANARLFYLGWLCLSVRAPWLAGPARRLHPECFDDTAEPGR